MSVKYESEGVVFNDVIAGIHTGGQKITGYEYTYDENGNIVEPQPIVNSIDIDWNNAQVPGLENSIDSTAALLKIIGDINNRIKSMEEHSGDGGQTSGQTDTQSHVMLTQEEYDALEEKDPNVVYFIVEDGDNPGGDTPTEPIDIPTTTQLLVNGTLHTEDNVILEPGQIYTLQGTCLGTITVDTTEYTYNQMKNLGNTELRLNGLTIVNDSNSGIIYATPQENKGYKDLIVTLEKNTVNYIICQNTAEPADDQPGALYSMNNLTVRGNGYLGVYNQAGHGIRATEVKLLGPNVYVDSSHDAIHGKKLWICGGSYYINKANDAFGTAIGGQIKYAFGHINANNLEGKLFNAKSGIVNEETINGTLEYIENFDLETDREYQITPTAANLLDVNTYIEMGEGIVYESDNNEDYKEGNYFGSDQVEVNESGVYVITKQYVFISGFISNPISICNLVGVNPTIYLQNAYIITNKVNNDNIPSIYFDQIKGSLNINVLSDSYNLIVNNCGEIDSNDGDAIKSEHNIKIEVKNDSYLYISSTAGDGVDGSDIEITDSKGTLMIRNCAERGIKGTTIIIGPSGKLNKGVLELITDPSDENNYTVFEGAAIVTDNCKKYGENDITISGGKIAPRTGYADIFARKGKALDKGTFVTHATELKGVLITGSIGATIAINMDNSANIYYKRLIASDTVVQTNISPVTNNNVTNSSIRTNINSLISNN